MAPPPNVLGIMLQSRPSSLGQDQSSQSQSLSLNNILSNAFAAVHHFYPARLGFALLATKPLLKQRTWSFSELRFFVVCAAVAIQCRRCRGCPCRVFLSSRSCSTAPRVAKEMLEVIQNRPPALPLGTLRIRMRVSLVVVVAVSHQAALLPFAAPLLGQRCCSGKHEKSCCCCCLLLLLLLLLCF